jgi:hypothetical protein
MAKLLDWQAEALARFLAEGGTPEVIPRGFGVIDPLQIPGPNGWFSDKRADPKRHQAQLAKARKRGGAKASGRNGKRKIE